VGDPPGDRRVADRVNETVGAPEEEPAEERAARELAEVTLATELVGAGKADWRAVVLPLLAVLAALVIGALVIVFTNQATLDAWKSFFRGPGDALSVSWKVVKDAYYALFSGAVGSPSRIARAIGSGDFGQVRSSLYPLSETIVTTTPLIFVGLSVAVGFQAGLFNIGAEGQMNAGAMVGAAAGIWWPGLFGPLHLALMVIACFVGGAIWGAIPGFLRAKTA
jgi:simple sugar transport system permease protein